MTEKQLWYGYEGTVDVTKLISKVLITKPIHEHCTHSNYAEIL